MKHSTMTDARSINQACMMQRKWLRSLAPLLGLLLFAVALWELHHELQTFHYHDLVRHVHSIPVGQLALALLLTGLSYFTLTGYDALALRSIHHPLAYGRIALASFVGYAFSHTIGVSWLTGGSVRYRLYSAWGLSALEVTQVIVFTILTFWLGFCTLGGVAFVLEPPAMPAWRLMPVASLRPIGVLFLSLVAGYLVWTTTRTQPLRIRGWTFSLPTTRLSLLQIGLGCVDWLLAGSVLYVLLPQQASLSFPGFLGIFLLAQILGMGSQVPGGLGVFESVILLLLPSSLPSPVVLGALFVYRGVYYLLPLGTAALLLGVHEASRQRAGVTRITRALRQWTTPLTPHVLACTTFLGGVILLVSGTVPAVPGHLRWLRTVLPLPAIEASHFVGSLVGMGLILLARGLQRRIDAAYGLTTVFLGTGVVVSLLKGLDYAEAIILAIMLVALLPCRHLFYRRASLFSQRFTLGWSVTITMILLGTFWLGLFAYQHVAYTPEIWWRFTLTGDAPRFLRASVGVMSLVVFWALARLLHPTSPPPASPSLTDMDTVRTLVAQSPKVVANLALLGDKAFIMNPSGTAFLMYGIEGRSWVAIGAPIGPPAACAELAWQFCDRCDRYGGWPVFYEVTADNLPLYLDLGLAPFKIGEEARVPLTTFSLEGRSRKGLRHTYRKLSHAGYAFEVVPQENVPPLLAELQAISDAWLAEKHTREKGFSLGSFKPEYVQQFPVALVRQAGKCVAFANIWLSAEHEELSPDLMRYLPEAPPGIMEYLFIALMLWGKQAGYHWFNLGMAPLAGLEQQPHASLWNRCGAFLFHHGEHFYHFEGLRQYKAKFNPTWTSAYLIAPGGLALPRILTNVTALIAGGLTGAIRR